MATFAKIDSNKVTNIVKVRNADINPNNNQSEEEAGISYLQGLFPNTTWKQVFYGNIPSVGYIYDPENGTFTDPEPVVDVDETPEPAADVDETPEQ